MPLSDMDDGNSAALLRRYRSLCEATGLARAHRLTLAESVANELSLVEARLIELLATPGSLGRTNQPDGSTGIISDSDDELADVATVYTDGSAEGNPGPGGYCAIIRIPGRPDRELSGGTNYTTNNKMELMAAIVGLRAAIDAGAKTVSVVSDSEYLTKGMTRWLSGWLAKGWKTSTGQPVKNQDLWEQLATLAKAATIQWQWIRGHAGHPENERCDAVATAAARQAARSKDF